MRPPRATARRSLSTFLFDLDGTLLDTVDLIIRCYRHTARTHLGAVPPESVWLAGLGKPLRRQIEELSPDPEKVEAMVATYREYHRLHHDDMVKPYPGAAEAVRRLKERGARLGVVTSKMRWSTERGLALSGFDGLFEVLVTAEDVEIHKPEPEPVLKAIELLESRAEETVFVGDSPHDMAAGRSAGVRIAAALWGPFDETDLAPHQPDYWLADPSDVAELWDEGP